MQSIDPVILNFIKDHYLLSISTSYKNFPYSANVYYVYISSKNSLVFASDLETRHAKEFLKNSNVSGTIALETKNIQKIQGVQILGKVKLVNEKNLKTYSQLYFNVFSYAKDMDIVFWEMRLIFIKMTNNRLGFGKKIIWKK